MTKTINMRPPIARLGGKSKLRSRLIPMFPEHTCYVEPFFGAGWIYFGKEPSKVEVINDLDSEVINLFRVLKLHGDELQRYIKNNFAINHSNRETFKNMQAIEKSTLTDIQRAARFLYLNKYSFASKGRHYGYATTQPPKKMIDVDRTKAISERLSNTNIESLDYSEIIKKYDREKTFFMVDPPYYETCLDFSFDQDVTFGLEEHIKLRDQLTKVKGKWLLTINDHPVIRDLYKDFDQIKVEVPYSVTKNKCNKFSELVIKNY